MAGTVWLPLLFVIQISDYEKSKAFYGKLLAFLGFEVSDEYPDAIGWTNGKTRFWIGPTGAEGGARLSRIGDIGFHHYAFQIRSRRNVDALRISSVRAVRISSTRRASLAMTIMPFSLWILTDSRSRA